MLESQTREIDGLTYTYQPLMLKPARALFDKLIQRFGPAIAAAVDGLKDAEIDEGAEIIQALGSIAGSVAGFLRGVVSGLDSKTHSEICDVIAKQMRVDYPQQDEGTKQMALMDVRELLFGQSLLTEFKVVMFGLQAQYDDFLAPMQSLATTAIALRAKAQSGSSSPRESSGSPIESPRVSDTATA